MFTLLRSRKNQNRIYWNCHCRLNCASVVPVISSYTSPILQTYINDINVMATLLHIKGDLVCARSAVFDQLEHEIQKALSNPKFMLLGQKSNAGLIKRAESFYRSVVVRKEFQNGRNSEKGKSMSNVEGYFLVDEGAPYARNATCLRSARKIQSFHSIILLWELRQHLL